MAMTKQETPADKKCARWKVFASAVRERVEYSAALAEQILGYIIDGKTLVEIEKADGMPSRSTILKWRRQHEEFGERYAEAMDLRADADADAVDDIGRRILRGEVDCNTGRAVIDALKWAASHRAPRRYGTKVSSEITGKDGTPITIASDHDQVETARRIALVLGMGMARLQANKLTDGESNE